MVALSRAWLSELARPRGPFARRAGIGLAVVLALLLLGSIASGSVSALSAEVSQTLTSAVCLLTLWLVFVTREAQAQEARALRQSLDALRESLQVAHALLEASELQDVEELRSSRLPREPATPRTAARDSKLPDSEDQTPRLNSGAMAAV